MRFWKASLLASWALGATAFAGGEFALTGVVKDISDQPVSGILINFTSGDDSASTRSGEDGSYSVDVENTGEAWTISLDEAELIALGYFCFPDFVWNPEIEPIDPVVIIPELTTVPLRPELTMERSTDGVSCVRLNFDWVDELVPTVLREYRIERSTDMNEWTEVMTVSLACPPIEFFDETVGDEEVCHYRAVEGTSFNVGELGPGDLIFVADPMIGGGPGDLVFVSGEPLPELPVMAPEIRLVEPE